MTRIAGFDFGKSYVKLAILSFASPGEAAGATVLRQDSFPVENEDKILVPRNDVGPLAAWLVAKADQVQDQKPDQIALTVPLPLITVSSQGEVYDSRPNWEFFGGKKEAAVERLLTDEVQERAGRTLPVRIMHDAESQICFVSRQCRLQDFRPQDFYAVAAFGTSIAFAVARGRGDELEIGKPSSTFSHAVLDQDGPTICESCGRRCIGAAYKAERERTDASVAAGRPKIEVRAVCHAVSVLCALPLKTLYVTGGYLQQQEVGAAIEQMEREMKYRSADVRLIPAKIAQFSGAIGAAYLLGQTTKPLHWCRNVV